MTPQARPSQAATRTREQVLADTFVLLADTLVDDYDIVDLLDQLVAGCLDLLGVSAAGLLIDDQQGHLVVIASSTEEARILEVFQVQNNEGPCLECVRTGVPIASGNVAAELDRWPSFVPAAREAGYQSVSALPMRLRGQTIGALNLFNSGIDSITDDDQRLARALADVATIGILQQRSTHQSNVVAEQLQHALNSRVLVEQAKGVQAERANVSIAEAFVQLRRFARNHNRKLTEVAAAVIAGESVEA